MGLFSLFDLSFDDLESDPLFDRFIKAICIKAFGGSGPLTGVDEKKNELLEGIKREKEQ